MNYIRNDSLAKILQNEIDGKGYIYITIHGNSMVPTLQNGERIKIEKNDTYNIGDIIAYFLVGEGKLFVVVHRIILKRDKYVLTKGDNNNFVDKLKVFNNIILGKVSQ